MKSSAPQRHVSATRPVFVLAALSAAVLAACGGGSDAPASNPPATPQLVISGVAATGAALAGAAVDASCASGSGSAQTATDGSYTVTIASGSLPCVLEATSGATTLHSVATGSADTATANITPLTEVLVAQLTGQDPVAFFASATATPSSLSTTVTPGAVTTAANAVVATLTAAGIDASSVTDMVSGSLTAGSGQGYDGVLDTLGTTLASSGSTLATLVTTVATTAAATGSSSTPPPASGSEAVSTSLLPASLLLKPKAAHCAALRSTSYQLIVMKASVATGGTDPVTTLGTATLDAANAAGPRWTYDDASSETMVPVDGDACHFTQAGNDGGSADVVVAPSGVVVMRSTATWTDGEPALDSNARLVIALPVQNLGVADLAGTWNLLGWSAEAGSSVVDAPMITLAADGAATVKCVDGNPAALESACATDGPHPGLSVNAAGGFDLTTTDVDGTYKDRVFAYRAGNGQTVAFGLMADGTMYAMTPYRTLTQPAVGDAHKAWNLFLNGARVVDPVAANGFAITAVDAAAGTFTRTATTLATGVSHSQTLALNNVRNGWMHRAAGTAAGSDGSTVTVREMYALKLGIGISAVYLPASNQAGTNGRWGLSVNQPTQP